jgi:hypothetical protein
MRTNAERRPEHRERMARRRAEQRDRQTRWQPMTGREHLNLRANARRLRQIAAGMLRP